MAIVDKTEVLVVDDHDIVRQGIRTILSDASDIEVAAEADSAAEALSWIRKRDFSVIILDISLPNQSGFDIIAHLKAEKDTPILILSMYPEEQFAVRTLRAGAYGYLNKEHAAERLIEAIRKVARREFYVSPGLTGELVKTLHNPSKDAGLDSLTDREYQVFLLIVQGKEMKELADELCISDKTARTHRTHILEKLKLKNNVELTKFAFDNQIL